MKIDPHCKDRRVEKKKKRDRDAPVKYPVDICTLTMEHEAAVCPVEAGVKMNLFVWCEVCFFLS